MAYAQNIIASLHHLMRMPSGFRLKPGSVIGLILFFYFPSSLFALTQHEQLWLDASINDQIANHESIDYNLEVQTRFQEGAGYETSFASGGLGYRATEQFSFWLGYERIAPDVIVDGPPADRIWEQMIWLIYESPDLAIRNRTLFEQTHLQGEAQWSNHLREKISFYFHDKFFNTTPLIYNEVFIKLNNPNWLEGTDTIEANNLFLGLDIPVSKTAFLEVGYIQQYLFSDFGNELNHVLYVGININPSGRTFPQYVR